MVEAMILARSELLPDLFGGMQAFFHRGDDALILRIDTVEYVADRLMQCFMMASAASSQ